ncbi:hypothetical protein EV426DRAFT_701418 [Tirmania nivea]|nr:hypothetical protein EV426DRAFT_701418 [Tirmania nivea]
MERAAASRHEEVIQTMSLWEGKIVTLLYQILEKAKAEATSSLTPTRMELDSEDSTTPGRKFKMEQYVARLARASAALPIPSTTTPGVLVVDLRTPSLLQRQPPSHTSLPSQVPTAQWKAIAGHATSKTPEQEPASMHMRKAKASDSFTPPLPSPSLSPPPAPSASASVKDETVVQPALPRHVPHHLPTSYAKVVAAPAPKTMELDTQLVHPSRAPLVNVFSTCSSPTTHPAPATNTLGRLATTQTPSTGSNQVPVGSRADKGKGKAMGTNPTQTALAGQKKLVRPT